MKIEQGRSTQPSSPSVDLSRVISNLVLDKFFKKNLNTKMKSYSFKF